MNNTVNPIIEPIMKMMGYGTIPETNDPIILQAESALVDYPEHLKMLQKFRDQDCYLEQLTAIKQYLDQATTFTKFKGLVGCSVYFFKDHTEINKLLSLICDLLTTIEINLSYTDPTISLQNINNLVSNSIQTINISTDKLLTIKQFIDELIEYNKIPSILCKNSLTPVIDDNYQILIDFIDEVNQQ